MTNKLAVLLCSVFVLALTGCMGWGDMFAPKHPIAGDYFLMQGEGGDDVYLMVKGQSVSVAGPLHQIGWSGQYVIFTDANWPEPWNVIIVSNHKGFRITEKQRQADRDLSGISLLAPQAAWKAKKS